MTPEQVGEHFTVVTRAKDLLPSLLADALRAAMKFEKQHRFYADPLERTDI